MLTETMHGMPQDLTRINVEEESQIRWWCVRLDTTPEALRALVREIGPSAEEVTQHLRQAAAVSFTQGGED